MANLVPQVSSLGAGIPHARQPRRAATSPLAAFRPGQKPPPGLILPNTIPGRSVGGGPPPKLIIPGGPKDINEVVNEERVPSNKYRPPPGFMDDKTDEADDIGASDPNALITRLKSKAGLWHEMARLFGPLQAQGMDASVIEEASGIPRPVQSIMRIAGDVRNSIKDGAVSEDAMKFYDMEDSFFRLYHLRFLAADQRAVGAQYIADKCLNAEESEELARAIKEHARRDGIAEGFTSAAGDCLAFKYFRNVLESRSSEEQEELAQKGIEAAVTDAARQALEELLDELTQTGSIKPAMSKLSILRLTSDELGLRALPVVGALGQVSSTQIDAAPTSTQAGPFGVFTTNGSGPQQWVSLPQWSVVTSASRPVAIEIADCSKVPALVETTAAKSKEDIKKLRGPGMLVAECGDITLTPESFFLTAKEDGPVDIVDAQAASSLPEGAVCGVVLFVCRPPEAGPTENFLF